jgi:GT2 family glycosyltransferase
VARAGDGGERADPTISVVIASNRDPARITRCLEGLVAQTAVEGGLEVVVVDDGAPVALDEAVGAFAPRLRARALRGPGRGPAAARNAGVAAAAGRFVAFTDDDCVAEPDWLRLLVEALVAQPDAIAGGTVRNLLEGDRYAQTTQRLFDFLYRSYGRGTTRRFFGSGNMALARDAFLAAGGFDESFPLPGGEDRELCERWQEAGRELVLVPDAVVVHAHPLTLATFVRQHRNYGRGAYRLRQRRPGGSGGGSVGPEPVGFYLRLLADPFGREPLPREVMQSALLAVTQVATAAGYVGERRRARSERPHV